MDHLYLALKGKRKMFLSNLIFEEKSRKKIFMLFTRSLLKKSKEFPDKICIDIIRNEFKKEFNKNKDLIFRNDIYFAIKEIYELNDNLEKSKDNFKSLKYIVSICYYVYSNSLKKNEIESPLLKKIQYMSKNNIKYRSIDCADIVRATPLNFYPEKVINNLKELSFNNENLNINRVYSKLFNLRANLSSNIMINDKKQLDFEKYKNYKKELMKDKINMSQIEFIASLFNIKTKL